MVGGRRRVLGDIEEFVTGHREHSSLDVDRVLATVLFTDIVDSTRLASAIGDQPWRHAGQSRPTRKADRREASRQINQDNWRRHSCDLRWPSPSYQMRDLFRRGSKTDRFASSGRSPHRRGRGERHRHWWNCCSRCRSGDGAISARRGLGIQSCQRLGGRGRPEVHRPWIV